MKNVKLEGVKKFLEEAKQNPENFKRVMKVSISWNEDESKPQMTTKVQFPQGEQEIQIDNAPFMGGQGRAPNPLQLCLTGMASCFMGTFASVAAEKGVELKNFRVEIENEVNLERPLGVSDKPVTEGIKITVFAEGVDKNTLEQLKEEAMKRCPAVFCITNPIPLDVKIA